MLMTLSRVAASSQVPDGHKTRSRAATKSSIVFRARHIFALNCMTCSVWVRVTMRKHKEQVWSITCNMRLPPVAFLATQG
eukprot:1780385-Amphidinium_carterae.1